jgi:hypothetical protein
VNGTHNIVSFEISNFTREFAESYEVGEKLNREELEFEILIDNKVTPWLGLISRFYRTIT